MTAQLLIVDDVEDNRTILGRRFRRRGYDVVEADGGRAALELIARQPFDLVLLDIMMPEVDGFEVLARVRTRHSDTALPIIMATAKDGSEDVVRALELGANDYITKPVDFPVAFARVQSQIARKRAEEGLRQANEQLEQRVAARTAELVATNARLEQEIEERCRAEAQMRHMAHHDALTGLANRVLFRDRLSQAVIRGGRHQKSVAVHCLDLDFFKNVNDTLGHPAGDILLKQVAERLLAAVRQTDTVARLGGDEFAIVQVDLTEPHNAETVASRILKALKEPFDLGGEKAHIGVSIGIALSPSDGKDPDQLLKAADTALYRAKSDGRHTFCFFEAGMNSALEARRVLEQDLRQALQNEEFELHYQPIVSLPLGTITGCEALIRWRHPERGLISPASFIPLAEETGLLIEIGDWALRTACAEASRWGAPLSVAVNLSPSQIKKNGFISKVVNALEATGLSPDRLELEITESTLLTNTEQVLETLRQLRQLGVHIAMDDFGTGYSSLGYLQKFLFDKIKIDRSFIANLATSREAAAIVRATIGLAEGLDIAVLAEGVETADQAAALASERCGQAQGYYFSRPRPADEIRHLLTRSPLTLPLGVPDVRAA